MKALVLSVVFALTSVVNAVSGNNVKDFAYNSENRGDVVRREAILDKFWNTEDDYFASRSLDVFVTKLRKLIAEDSSVSIKTVKGVGLMLEENV